MENDSLKKYVQEHRSDFDDEVLPPGSFLKMLNKIKKKRSLKNIRTAGTIAAACVLFLLISIIMPQNQKQVKEIKYTPVATTQEKEIEPSKTQEVQNSMIAAVKIKPGSISSKQKRPVKSDPDKKILIGLTDNSSVAARINAVLEAGELKGLNQTMKEALCQTFTNDENSNVRLAALNVLAKYTHDEFARKWLLNGMSTQNDPVIQIELVRIMSNDNDSAVTEKLIQMADSPFTIPDVKDQVYYALLTRK